MKSLVGNLRIAATISAAAVLSLVTLPSSAANVFWIGTNGVSADTNWSDTANWAVAKPDNNAANFNFNTAVAAPGIVTVNADGDYGSPGSGNANAWGIVFGQTNGYHTVLIQPGIQMQMVAANGTTGNGGFGVEPASQTSGGVGGGGTVNTGPYTNYTTIWGTNASLWVNGQFRMEGPANAVENHYSILDMTGLDTFIVTNTGGAAGFRFQVVNGSQRSQALLYLAKTNIITIASDVTIGFIGGTYSNSLPIGVYLGQSNFITTGPNDNGNQMAIAIQGVTNAFLKFNPIFLGGPSKPTVFISGNGQATGNGGFPAVSGMMAGCIIGRADTAKVPSFGNVDFTGGIVTWNVGQLQLGRAGIAPTNGATGILSFDSGTITANDVWCGWQQFDASGTQGASPAVGVINVGANATLQVNNILRLGLVTNVQASGTSGSLNVNGGAVILNLVTNSPTASGDSINLTNATVGVILNQVGITNIPVTTLSLGGTTNVINIVSITPELGSGFPVRFHLLSYKTLNGSLNFGLGTLPTSYNPSFTYGGYLDTTSTVGVVDFVLTQGPPAARFLTWSGLNSGVPDGSWDVGTTPNWLNNAVATTYNQFDLVTFNDSAATGATNVSMTTTLTPYSVTVSNSAVAFTLGGSGQISGSTTLLKQGSGTLVLDDSGGNNFTGGILNTNGRLQVGNGDGLGNIGSGTVTNGGTLIFDEGAQSTVANTISGSGSVVQAGGDTLTLSGGNVYTGTTTVTNSSTLKAGSATALGATNGVAIVASGSTLDGNGFGFGSKPIIVSGTGVGGNGALANSGGPIYDSGAGFTTTLTLAGDATFSYGTRWDLASGAVINSGGHNLTLNGTGGYFEWLNVHPDTNLANINVIAGTLGIVGSTTLGNPTNSMALASGAGTTFYNSGAVNVMVNKQVVVNDGATVQNGGGANLIGGVVVVTNSGGSSFCTFNIGGTSLTLSNAITGNGILYKQSGTSPLILSGNSPAFSGGVAVYAGPLVLNGTVGSGVTNQPGTSITGTGASSGSMDISGGLTPGGANAAGTLTVGGGLILEGTALVTNNLTSATTLGGGVNSLIQVTGDVTANGNTLYINPLAPLANNGTYTIITYTGNLNGSFAGAVTVTPSPYTFNVVNLTSSSPKKIQVVVTGGGSPSTLVWNNSAGNGEWDVDLSPNWSNVTTHAASDYFFAFDPVLFLDSVTNSSNPSTTIDIAAGQVVAPSVVTNNSATNYTISGAGKISGGASLVKMGSSTLTISTADDFTGPTTILGGTVVAANSSALGATNGTITVTNGGTLDVYGFNLNGKPLLVAGVGVNSNGVIVNNGPSPVYDNPGGLSTVTLAADTTFGAGNNRWDLGSAAGAVLSTGGKPYNLSMNGVSGSTYWEWESVATDTNLANINILGGELGVKGTTTLGNPTNTVTINAGGQMTFWGGSGYAKNFDVKSNGNMVVRFDGPTFNFNVTLEGGSMFNSINSAKVITGTVVFSGGLAHILNGNASTTFSNVISGPGGFYMDAYDSNPLIFTATNTYSGPTLITGGGLVLALSGSGSIANSIGIYIASGSTLDVSGRSDDTLTLASGQILEGNGTINGNLIVSSGSTVEPGTNGVVGTLTVNNTATLQGTTTMALTAPSTSSQLRAASVNYGGALNLSFAPGSLAAGDSFKLFNSGTTYNLSFSSISPSQPGPGLTWNASLLNSSGTLSVAASSPPAINNIHISGGNIIFSGTNGTPGGNYRLLESTNVALPLGQWSIIATNSFDSGGNFSVTNANTLPVQFFSIQPF